MAQQEILFLTSRDFGIFYFLITIKGDLLFSNEEIYFLKEMAKKWEVIQSRNLQ